MSEPLAEGNDLIHVGIGFYQASKRLLAHIGNVGIRMGPANAAHHRGGEHDVADRTETYYKDAWPHVGAKIELWDHFPAFNGRLNFYPEHGRAVNELPEDHGACCSIVVRVLVHGGNPELHPLVRAGQTFGIDVAVEEPVIETGSRNRIEGSIRVWPTGFYHQVDMGKTGLPWTFTKDETIAYIKDYLLGLGMTIIYRKKKKAGE